MMGSLFILLTVLGAASESAPLAVLTVSPASEQQTNSPASESTAVLADVEPCDAPMRLTRKSRILQRRLESSLANANLSRYTRSHRLSVALVDVTRPDELYYAGVNDDDMIYAASLPKIAILLAVADAAKQGKVKWTPEFDERLGSMIKESSNANATWGARLVGLHAIERALRDPQYCFYDNVHGGLWVGRPYASGGEENRDPLKELSHGATARQAARFYTLLEREELVSRDWSRHLLKIMGPPKHHHKFVGGLAERQGITFLARKSGTWRDWHSDSALIQHDDRRYIAVALSELRKGEAVMHEVIRLLDDIIMDGRHRRPPNS